MADTTLDLLNQTQIELLQKYDGALNRFNEINNYFEDGKAIKAINAEKLDGFEASQNPSSRQIPVLNNRGQIQLPFNQIPILVNNQELLNRKFYVDAENGDDSNNGTAGAPFATLKKAIDSIPSGGTVTVNLIGDYTMRENITVINKRVVINVSKNATIKIKWYQDSRNAYNWLYGFNVYGFVGLEFWMGDGARILLDDEGYSTTTNSGTSSYYQFIRKSNSCVGYVYVRKIYGATVNPIIEIAGVDSTPIFMNHGNAHSSEFLVLHLHRVDVIKSGDGLLTAGDGIFGLKVIEVNIKDKDGNSLAWTDVIGGIIRDANGVPRNVISNIIL